MSERPSLKITRRSLLVTAALTAALVGCDAPRGRATGGGVPARPKSFLRTSWSKDPFAMCSYSFLAPSPLGVGIRDRMAASVGGRLHFAGEATSSDAPATTTGALLSGRRAADQILKNARKGQSIAIVGAGFAGLGCARALTDAGMKVTVLEGRDRVGGRIWTKHIAGMPAEMGASWIHSWKGGNPISQLLKESGGRNVPFNYDSVAGVDRKAMAELKPYARKLNQVDDPDITAIGDVFPEHPSAALQCAANQEYTQEYAAEPDDLSVSALEEGTGGSGGDVLLPDGYDKLIAVLKGSVRVRTGATVSAVAYSDAGTRVSLAGGEQIAADHCVITVPIGVLKAQRIAFSPALPADKQQAIKDLGAGLLDKIWLEFDEVFWDRDASNIEFFDRDNPGLWSYWVNGHKAFGKPVLVGFNAGARAHQLASQTDEQVVASAMAALRRMYPK